MIDKSERERENLPLPIIIDETFGTGKVMKQRAEGPAAICIVLFEHFRAEILAGKALNLFTGRVERSRTAAGEFIEEHFGRDNLVERHTAVGELTAEYSDTVNVRPGAVAFHVLAENFGGSYVEEGVGKVCGIFVDRRVELAVAEH